MSSALLLFSHAPGMQLLGGVPHAWGGAATGSVCRRAAACCCVALATHTGCTTTHQHAIICCYCSYDWIDEDTIVAAIVPPGLGAPPRKLLTPLGPKIEART